MAEGYATLAGPHEVEIDKIKRSRFIGLASPCPSAEQAKAFVDAQRARFHDARHHAFAWRIEGASRASDDGEPHHSAGAPILRELEGRELGNVIVVVVRYFGGVKLGTGGLARAYGAAAAAVLDGASQHRVVTRTPLRLTYDYALASAMQRVLHQLGLAPVQASYAAEVCLTVHLAAERVDDVQTALRDASGGAAKLELLEPVAVRCS